MEKFCFFGVDFKGRLFFEQDFIYVYLLMYKDCFVFVKDFFFKFVKMIFRCNFVLEVEVK